MTHSWVLRHSLSVTFIYNNWMQIRVLCSIFERFPLLFTFFLRCHTLLWSFVAVASWQHSNQHVDNRQHKITQNSTNEFGHFFPLHSVKVPLAISFILVVALVSPVFGLGQEIFSLWDRGCCWLFINVIDLGCYFCVQGGWVIRALRLLHPN